MRSRQLLLIMIVFALYGALAFSGYRIFMMALLVILLLTAASFVQLLWVRQQIAISQTLQQEPVFTGDPANLIVRVSNRNRWPIAALELEVRQNRRELLQPIIDSRPFNADGTPQRLFPVKRWLHQTLHPPERPLMLKRRIISVFGRSTLNDAVPLLTDDARIFSVGLSQVRIRDPFNLFRLPVRQSGNVQPAALRLHVLPRPHEQLTFESLYRINAEGFHTALKQSDEVNAIADLRQMRPGDSPKRIHWIVSAKQNHWMIKTFEKEEQGNVLLLPDLDNAHLPERRQQHHRNALLSVTAGAVRQLLAYDLALMLVTSGEAIQTSYADRPDQMLDLLIQLASTPDKSNEPLQSQLQEGLSRLPDDCTIVLVSSQPDEELARLSREMISAGHPVFLIFYRDPGDPTEEPEEWFRQFQQTGAGLIKVYEHETTH